MAIEFSKSADADLLGILEHGIDQYGLARAEDYMSRLDGSFRALSKNPEIARLRPEIIPPVRAHPSQSHVIVYTILDDGKTILVLRVRHHREDWTKAF